MTVRAAVMTKPGAPMEVWDIPSPDLEEGAVLLETVASEVCGTDVHLYHGRLAATISETVSNVGMPRHWWRRSACGFICVCDIVSVIP